MRYISWKEFNSCVESISLSCRDEKFTGVFGFPRGGLCLAVALSHSLQIPFLDKPKTGALIIDDIYETGKTINSIRDIPNTKTFVWLSKTNPIWWEAFEVISPEEWVIFPWENSAHAKKDKENYFRSRSLLK